MKVLMTADTVGGVFTYALELARALGPLGVEVLLATKGRAPSADQRAAAAFIGNLTVVESDYRLEWQDEPWEDVARASAWLLELEARHSPDLVHLNDYAHGALPFRAPVLVVAHSCVLSWWEAVRRSAAPAAWDRYRNEVRLGLAGADAVVAPSRAMRAALERHHGPPGARAEVIPNGRDPAGLEPLPKEPLVMAAGRLWDEAKNIRLLAEAAPRVKWPVFAAGDPGGPALAGVRPLGRLAAPALAGWLRRAALYALPVRYEPFGLSILEAALAGCALVVGDIDSQRELWGGAAELVPPEDARALARALNALIADPARRERLAALARARALTFSPRRMAAAYHRLYRRLISGLEAPACASSSSATR
jgi:glycosyltransferase involved in cell wall biosynthesis